MLTFRLYRQHRRTRTLQHITSYQAPDLGAAVAMARNYTCYITDSWKLRLRPVREGK